MKRKVNSNVNLNAILDSSFTNQSPRANQIEIRCDDGHGNEKKVNLKGMMGVSTNFTKPKLEGLPQKQNENINYDELLEIIEDSQESDELSSIHSELEHEVHAMEDNFSFSSDDPFQDGDLSARSDSDVN